MWNPKRIEFENLFAHHHSAYEFKEGQCVVIFGKNETDRSLDNNGAGKTTLFEAICISLTGDSLRNIKKDDFINDSADTCKITFELYNPVMKMTLLIVRTFFRGSKSSKVEIWENGKQNNQVVSVLEANKRVIELLGISKEDLLRYYIISQDNNYTFFTASDVEKKEIMNRITSADMIQPAIDELKKRFAEADDELGEISNNILSTETRISTLEEQKLELLVDNSVDEEIAEIREDIKSHEGRIKTNKDSIELHKKNIKKINEEISKLGGRPNVTEIDEKVISCRRSLNKVSKELNEGREVSSALAAELQGKVTCPDCNAEFIPESKLGLTYQEALAAKEEADAEVERLVKEKQTANKKYEDACAESEKMERLDRKIRSLESDIRTEETAIKNNEFNIQNIEKNIKRANERIENLQKKKEDDSAVKTIESKLKTLNGNLTKYRKQRKELEEKVEMINFWLFNMGKSGFMTYLANQSIKIIEGVTNSYLRKFGVDISVIVNGFKILKSGEVREKIDVFVTNDGITAKQFMAKSGGERGRVMLAGVLGIQHLINMSTNGKGLNLLLFDECFHGIDSIGQENIIKIFEKMGITMLVITQNVNEGFNNENTLFVEKVNGVSRYIS